MLYGSERGDLRRAWVAAWSKSRAGQALEPLERPLAEVISDHPEYHAALESRDALEREFHPEAGQSNPFLHMGLHVAIREQLATDRPPGVRKLYAALLPGFCPGTRTRTGWSTRSWSVSPRRCGTRSAPGASRTKHATCAACNGWGNDGGDSAHWIGKVHDPVGPHDRAVLQAAVPYGARQLPSVPTSHEMVYFLL